MEITINQYDVIQTGRYNGQFQIKLGSIWKDGEFHPYFREVKKKEGRTFNVPVTLTFENDDQAKTILFQMLTSEFGVYDYTKPVLDTAPNPDDIPF